MKRTSLGAERGALWPGGASDWLPLERTPDAAGGFYTTEEEMDEDARKLEALKNQFVYHFPYVRELATAPASCARRVELAEGQEGTRRAKQPESRPQS